MLARHRSAPRISEARTISGPQSRAHLRAVRHRSPGRDRLSGDGVPGGRDARRPAGTRVRSGDDDHAFRSTHRSSSGQCLDAVNAAVPRDVHLIVDN